MGKIWKHVFEEIVSKSYPNDTTEEDKHFPKLSAEDRAKVMSFHDAMVKFERMMKHD